MEPLSISSTLGLGGIAPESRGSRSAPIYRELYRRLRSAIIAGDIEAGQRLPSSRVLAAQLAVGRNTVLLAYEQLHSEGYVESRLGSGHYVAPFVNGAFNRLGATVAHVAPEPAHSGARIANTFAFVPASLRRAHPEVPFRVNLPALDGVRMQPWVRLYSRMFREAARSQRHPGHFGEIDAAGDSLLRRAIAEHVAISRGVRCSPDQVIVTAGAQHAMDLLMRVCARTTEAAWIEDPCFPGALAVLRGAGLKVVPVPVDRDGFDVEQAVRAAPRASLAIVCPSKQFPLGHVMSLQRRLLLIEWARKRGAWIIEDDYDSEYQFAGMAIPSLQGLDGGRCVIYVGTFSKILFPGLRIGFIVAPPVLVDPIIGARVLAGRHGNPLDQQVLARFILDGYLGRHVRHMRRLYKARMQALLDSADRWLTPALRVEPTNAGLQTMGWLDRGFSDRQVSESAAQNGLEAANLSRYCIHARCPPALVLGFGAFAEEELAAGARKLAALLDCQTKARGGKGTRRR